MSEPGYIHTNPFDGGKYIDSEAFLKDPEIQRQLDWFASLDAKECTPPRPSRAVLDCLWLSFDGLALNLRYPFKCRC